MTEKTLPKALTQVKPSGSDVWEWPEFQAFAKRLMIDIEGPTITLTITIPVDDPVVITQEYHGLDSETNR